MTQANNPSQSLLNTQNLTTMSYTLSLIRETLPAWRRHFPNRGKPCRRGGDTFPTSGNLAGEAETLSQPRETLPTWAGTFPEIKTVKS